MKSGVFLKAGFGCAGLFVVFAIVMTVFVMYRKHAYRTMKDTHDLKPRISNLASNYVTKRSNVALVIGVTQRGKTGVFGFGRVSANNSATPDGDTIFEIGSITKVFTATTLARMANDGVVRLEDTASQHLPGKQLPEKDEHAIRLGHLATHTAGLPRLPDDLLPNAKDQENPYANYGSKELYDTLAKTELKSVPGEKMFYSNFGYGLLGHLLALKAGTNYESLIREKICAPLEMNDTTVTLTESQQSRLTPGHDPKGVVVKNWDFDALAGAGALRSTVNDLLKFMAANLADGTNALASAMAECQKIHFREFAGGIGLAWQIRNPAEGQHWHWHNGGTGGYVSFLGFDKTTQVGVVILSNYGDAMAGDNAVDVMGVEILRLLPKISLE